MMRFFWISIIALSLLGSAAYGDTISLRGKSVVTIQPDIFAVEIVVQVAPDDGSNPWRSLKSSLEDLFELVRQQGVTREEFVVTWINVEHRQSKPEAYAAVYITVPVAESNGALVDAIQRGTNARVNSFRYARTNEQELRDAALALAVKDAVAQMEVLAASSGKKLGAVVRIGEKQRATEVITTRHESSSTKRATPRSVPLSPGKLSIRENIEVEAELLSVD